MGQTYKKGHIDFMYGNTGTQQSLGAKQQYCHVCKNSFKTTIDIGRVGKFCDTFHTFHIYLMCVIVCHKKYV